jgi:hypothetical protein
VTVDTTTYLGITISSNMTWNAAHINNIESKAQKLLGFFLGETSK